MPDNFRKVLILTPFPNGGWVINEADAVSVDVANIRNLASVSTDGLLLTHIDQYCGRKSLPPERWEE